MGIDQAPIEMREERMISHFGNGVFPIRVPLPFHREGMLAGSTMIWYLTKRQAPILVANGKLIRGS